MPKTGILPPMDGEDKFMTYLNMDDRIIYVTLNGERQALKIVDAVALANTIMSTVEVALRHG